MGDYIIELKNISKCYEGDTAAVDNVSLSIAKGEFVNVIRSVRVWQDDDPANDRWI